MHRCLRPGRHVKRFIDSEFTLVYTETSETRYLQDIHALTQTRAHTHTHTPAWTHPSTPSTHILMSYDTLCLCVSSTTFFPARAHAHTYTNKYTQSDCEKWRHKVLLGISLGGGVQTNGPPDVCVFVSTGDHVWVMETEIPGISIETF